MNKYGRFSSDNREFIITRPDTPAPWTNYLTNGRFHGIISQTGGGFSFYLTPKDHRITRWRYNSLPADRPGRYLLFRDSDTGDFWSPTWQPTVNQLAHFECRHGLYYTRIRSEFRGLETDILYFIPSDDVEVWRVKVKNNNENAVSLDVFAFVELCLGHALVDLINQPNDQHFNEVYFDKKLNAIVGSKRYWVPNAGISVGQANREWPYRIFFSADIPISRWDCSRDLFIGRWRSESNPIAVANGACTKSDITAGDAVAALQLPVKIPAGGEKEWSVFMGIAEKGQFYKSAEKVLNRYNKKDTVAEEFDKLCRNWQSYTDAIKVTTPDENMNRLLNVWNQYQTSVTFQFARDASYHHGGLLFGRGYRDAAQDMLGPLITKQQWARQRIIEMSGYQFSNGSTYHLYHPHTGGGERTGHSDTPLWLPLAAISYLKETGDWALLDVETDFADDGKATIKDHIHAAADYVINDLSANHLAHIRNGDWNDTLDYLGRGGKGESVWVTMLLAYVLNEMAGLMQHMADGENEMKYRDIYRKIKNKINSSCWDGQWYIRATNDLGQAIGSKSNNEGKIFLNTQSWAVISGIAEGKRALVCMDAVREYLETEKGPKIQHPAYTEIDENIGLITRCVAGKKENGAIFNHTVAWAIMAECLLGRGDRAFEIYKKSQPMNEVIDIDRYTAEPYVYAEYVTSPDHETFGQASHSWLTGSSAWMLRDGIDYILGVRPEYDGLRIDPCIPASWKEFKVERKFRGKRYNITVSNPDGISHGVAVIRIGGKELPDNLILCDPARPDQDNKELETVDVNVVMGK